MKWPLYQRVALKHDIAEEGMKRGDVATLVDTVPHPEGGEDGCVLEVFNAVGESIKVLTVPESGIESLHAGEVLTVHDTDVGHRVDLPTFLHLALLVVSGQGVA